MTSLDLGANGFNRKTSDELVKIFKAIPQGVTSLDLGENSLDNYMNDHLRLMGKALFQNSALTTINLGDNFRKSQREALLRYSPNKNMRALRVCHKKAQAEKRHDKGLQSLPSVLLDVIEKQMTKTPDIMRYLMQHERDKIAHLQRTESNITLNTKKHDGLKEADVAKTVKALKDNNQSLGNLDMALAHPTQENIQALEAQANTLKRNPKLVALGAMLLSIAGILIASAIATFSMGAALPVYSSLAASSIAVGIGGEITLFKSGDKRRSFDSAVKRIELASSPASAEPTPAESEEHAGGLSLSLSGD